MGNGAKVYSGGCTISLVSHLQIGNNSCGFVNICENLVSCKIFALLCL